MITPKEDDPLKREASKAQLLANSKALLGKVLSPTKEKFPTPAAAIDGGNGPMPNGTSAVAEVDSGPPGGNTSNSSSCNSTGDDSGLGGGGGIGGGNDNSNSAINNNSINNNTAELNGTVPDELEGVCDSTTRSEQDGDRKVPPLLDSAMTNVSIYGDDQSF